MNELFSLNPRRIGKKPIGQYEIDYSSQLSNISTDVYCFSSKSISLLGYKSTEVNTPERHADYNLYLDNADAQLYDNRIDVSKPFVIHCKFRKVTGGSYWSAFLGINDAHLTSNGIYAYQSNTTSVFVWIEGTAYYIYAPEDIDHDLVLHYDGNVCSILFDGVLEHNPTVSITNSGYSNTSIGSRHGNDGTGPKDEFYGRIYSLTASNVNAPLEVARTLHKDPYQFLKPKTIQDAVYATLFNTGPTAVNDAYDVTAGQQLVVPALTGILANDTYTCS